MSDMNKTRFTMSMYGTDMIVAIVDGNPGAITAVMEMVKASPTVDPDSMLGGMTPLFSLDTFGVYGSSIWILYSDICGRDPVKALAVLRAAQLGFLPFEDLREACEEKHPPTKRLDVDDLLAKVRERLPRFGAVTSQAEATK